MKKFIICITLLLPVFALANPDIQLPKGFESNAHVVVGAAHFNTLSRAYQT